MTSKETIDKRLAELSDYAALKKLAAALWQNDSAYHGAAVMVGAGFSRSAAHSGDRSNKLPLWNNLSKSLKNELGDVDISDPLRLAEEYSAFFGKQALHDLVKRELNDGAWLPGELHKQLLEMPWTDILTTNWDTLLERASQEVHDPVYNVVCKQEDLSSARTPRIVKLHGTVNVTENLVFTQEDYRKYPERHAAFVNLARQVFIENELCLLGFSGDDPNFLQWAGWVRDHLSLHARRIYLVGALNLTSAKRKYLESINVAPIDLGQLVAEFDNQDSKHSEATRIFLQALLAFKPVPIWDWSPTGLLDTSHASGDIGNQSSNLDHEATQLKHMLPSLKAIRESYPGWLVCPNRPRFELTMQLNNPFPRPDNLAKMASDDRVKFLYEIAWRHSITFEALTPWLVRELLTICDPKKPNVLSKKQQMEVALLLLKNTRWMDDAESDLVISSTTSILESNLKHWPESANELAYHQAIVARDTFDYSMLEVLCEKISVLDPTWKLRKASILAELGKFDEGERLIEEAHRELLLHYRNDRNSIFVLSRLAWAYWLLSGIEIMRRLTFESFPSSYQRAKCNPWDHIENLRDRISKELDSQHTRQNIQPSFEPGIYFDNSQSQKFSSAIHPLLLLEGIACTVGLPLRWRSVGFLIEQASRLVELSDLDGLLSLKLAIRAATSDSAEVLKSAFSRINVASMPGDDAQKLLSHCRQAIDYWLSKSSHGSGSVKQYALDRLAVFVEVLARLSVRSTPDQAKELFDLACRLGEMNEFRNFRHFDALRHLIKYSLSSIPEHEHHELLHVALSFPLAHEAHVSEKHGWPNPVIASPGNRSANTAMDRRIDAIIDGIRPFGAGSKASILRLMPLLEHKFLTNQECEKIAEKLWGKESQYTTLPETGLLKWTLLKLPAPNQPAVKHLVRQHLFRAEGHYLFDPALLEDIANVAQAGQFQELPSEIEAINYFDRLVLWRPKPIESDSIWIPNQEPSANLVGRVLAYSVVPALPAESMTEENFRKLYDFYSQAGSPEAIVAFPIFAINNPDFSERVVKLIGQGFQEQEPRRIASASFALLKWRKESCSEAINNLILRMVFLIGTRRIAALPSLLWSARQMLNDNYLTVDQTSSLTEILPVIFDYTAYSEAAFSRHDAVNVSLVRAETVKLARDIIRKIDDSHSDLHVLLEIAKQDALPEVRFAEYAIN